VELLGGVLLFIVTACWIGFIFFILFAIGGLIYFALEDAFDGIGGNSGGISRWFKENERIGRFRALLGIRWILWRANRHLEYQARRRQR
jgi:hypothetical protein